MPRKKTEDPSVPDILEQVTENTAPAEIIPEQQPVQLGSEDDLTLAEVPAEDLPAAEPMEEPEEAPSPILRTTNRKKPVIEEVEEALEEPLPNAEENTTLPAVPQEVSNPTEPVPSRNDFFSLDFHALDRDLTPEQRQEWNSIYASFRGHNIMTGTIIGVDLHKFNIHDKNTGDVTRRGLNCAIVIPFRVRILIPETELWETENERPGFVARAMTGATIDFVITHVDREAGFAIASRRMALILKKRSFAKQAALNQPGTRLKCRVLAVGPRRCLVECHGHDIEMTQREMRYTAIPDLRNEYHTGDEIDCIVKQYSRRQRELQISVKEVNPNPFDDAILRHPIGSHRQAVISGKYGGGVFCNLPDDSVCMCSYAFRYDDSSFQIGDRVILVIQHYDMEKKQIYGKIVSKW